jgi:hypothetical protein
LSRRRVLAISPDLDLLRRVVAILERAGAVVDAVRSTSAVSGAIIPHRYIFHAVEDGGAAELEKILPRIRNSAHIAVFTPAARLEDQTRLLRDPRVNHIIVGDELERGIFVTAQKLLTGDIFGIEKYLPEGTPVHYLRLDDFTGRGKAIDTILEYAESQKIRKKLRSAIGQVAEELLMNALYDAPVDEQGRQMFAEVEPHQRTKSKSPRPVSIRYAVTEQQFSIAVRDRFGRLAKNTILSYIEKCMSAGNQIDRKAYGAGLGLYLVANAVASYVVNVAYDIATEVVCTFDRGTKAPLRLVGVFVHPHGAEQLGRGPTAAIPAAIDDVDPPTDRVVIGDETEPGAGPPTDHVIEVEDP